MSTWACTPRSRSRALLFAATLALLLVFVYSVPAFAANTLIVDGSDPTCNNATGPVYCTVQAAINAAASGDTVFVKNGTYLETLDIYKSLTLEGESQAGVIIDATASADYGIDAYDTTAALNFVFRNFTLKGPQPTPSTGNYGLKVSGDNVTATLENITVTGGRKTGIDLNGVNSALVRNVTVTGITAGNGIALSDAANVTLENITTSGNAWGGLALYAGNAFTPNTANVTLQGINNLGEANPIYIEPLVSKVVKNLTLPGYTHVVQNPAKPNHFFLQPSAAAAAAFAATFPNPAASRITSYVPGATYVAAGSTLQSLIDAAAPGDTLLLSPGLYTQDITVSTHVKLVGSGSGSDPATATILRRTSTGSAVVLSGSGQSNSDPILLKDLRIEPMGQYGINMGNAQYVRLENVQVAGSAGTNVESEVGLKISTAASVSDLTVVNSGFSNCDHGWYFAKNPEAAGGSYVRNVYVADTSFANNGFKGIYVEKLSDATFVNVSVTDNGSLPYWNDVWNAGIDVNLKGQEAYQNLVFQNLTMTGNGKGFKHGAALLIKARDDASSYNTFPASLTNVTIEGGVFTGNERGIRIGEPDKNNNGPTNVQIHNAAIYGNVKTYVGVDGSAYGGLINYSKAPVNAEYNWWGSATGPTNSGNPGGTGEVVANVSSGSIDYTPWLGYTPDVALYVLGDPIDLRTGATSFTLPVNANGGNFSSTAFSLDYDTACLSISPADVNGDDVVDAVTGIPGGFVGTVKLDTADTDGELDVAMWDPTAPLAYMSNGTILSIKFDILPACQGSDHTTYVKFSGDPAPSFSDTQGNAVSRTTLNADPLLLDFNQAPMAILLSWTHVAEDAPVGSRIGGLSVTDSDGDAPVFTLVTGCPAGGDADNAAFAISGSDFKTAVLFDFEHTNPIKKVCIQADDGQGGVFQQSLTITIDDVNEPPTNIKLSKHEVAEGAPLGTVVGTLTTEGDPENAPANSFVYTLVSGDGAADNTKFAIDGSQLKTAAAVDYATQPVYYIRVRSTDPGNEFVEKQFVINVLDHSLLSIAETHVVRHSQQIGIPVVFAANGNTPTAASFTVSYNAACLTYVSTAGGTGSASGGAVTVNTNGPFVNGTLVTITFSAISSCQSGTSVPLNFTAASLTGASGPLPVDTDNGKVLVISNSNRGDCNNDGSVNAGDFSAIVLETFDADEPWWLNAPQSTFPGSPRGCDANASEYIDVADVVCTVLVVFGNSSCTGGSLLAAGAAEPAVLGVDAALNGQAVEVPVTLDAKGAAIAGAAFTFTYDPQQMVFDESDGDGDGLPDAVVFAAAKELKRSVSVDAANGRIKVAVYGVSLPLPAIDSGLLATIRLQAQGEQPLASLGLADAALGNTAGSNTPVEIEVKGVGQTMHLYLPAISN